MVLVLMAAANLAGHGLHLNSLWLGPVTAAFLLLVARLSGLSWVQLGLGRDRLATGLAWGCGAIAVVAAVYVAGVLIPLTRPAFLDSRYHVGLSRALLIAFVVIPAGTVLLEEIAFRSVLWGMLSRQAPAAAVLLATSVLFGLWHVLPALKASANQGVSQALGWAGPAAGVVLIIGTVAFTAAGGVVAGELRRRSGSLLASVGMHWATNSLGVLFGVLAWQLAR